MARAVLADLFGLIKQIFQSIAYFLYSTFTAESSNEASEGGGEPSYSDIFGEFDPGGPIDDCVESDSWDTLTYYVLALSSLALFAALLFRVLLRSSLIVTFLIKRLAAADRSLSCASDLPDGDARRRERRERPVCPVIYSSPQQQDDYWLNALLAWLANAAPSADPTTGTEQPGGLLANVLQHWLKALNDSVRSNSSSRVHC